MGSLALFPCQYNQIRLLVNFQRRNKSIQLLVQPGIRRFERAVMGIVTNIRGNENKIREGLIIQVNLHLGQRDDMLLTARLIQTNWYLAMTPKL